MLELVEDFVHILHAPVREQIDQHEVELAEHQGQETFAALAAGSADDGIHLDNGRRGVELHVILEIVIEPPEAVLAVDLSAGIVIFFLYAEADLPLEVDVPYVQKAHVDVPVEGGLAEREQFRMGDIDMVHAVVFVDHKGRNDLVDRVYLFLCDPEVGALQGERVAVFTVRDGSVIHLFCLITVEDLPAAVADIRSFQQLLTGRLPALPVGLYVTVFLYLFCDRGPVLMDPGPDPGEGVSVVEELMDHAPVLIGEMPVLFRNFIVIVHVVRPFQAYPYQRRDCTTEKDKPPKVCQSKIPKL